MTRKSKREIERDLENLKPNESDGQGGILFNMTNVRGDSAHPELTVERWPDSPHHDERGIAVPKVWPQELAGESIMFVESCENAVTETWSGEPEDRDKTILACKIWDVMTDKELQQEYEYRDENDEPIPTMLEEYGPE